MSHPIPLTKEKFAIVDDEDYEFLSQFKWCVDSGGYAVRSAYPNKGLIFMHRAILKTPKGLFTDHINHNKLDNRKCNLRIVTTRQNNMNYGKRNGSSIYNGVHWDKQLKYWRTRIRNGNKAILVGVFTKERWAAMAYDITAKYLRGQYANLNFKQVKGQPYVN